MRAMAAFWWAGVTLAAVASGTPLAAERTAAELEADKEAELERRAAEYNAAEEQRQANRQEFVRGLDQFRVTQVTFLDPRLPGDIPSDAQRLHRYPVFSSVELHDDALGAELKGSLVKVLEDRNNGMAACFSPRHVLRISDGTSTYDVVTCFQCWRYAVYWLDGSMWFGDSFSSRKEEPEWTRLFRQAGLEWPFK